MTEVPVVRDCVLPSLPPHVPRADPWKQPPVDGLALSPFPLCGRPQRGRETVAWMMELTWGPGTVHLWTSFINGE